MALVRWQPRQVCGFGSGFSGSGFDRFFDNVWGNAPSDQSTWYPSVDISESEEAIAVAAEIPGLKAEDIKVSVTNGVLAIEGEKKEEKREDQKQAHRVERTYGSFRRAFRLSTAVDTENITASYRDGVLSLSLPKAETAKTKEIQSHG